MKLIQYLNNHTQVTIYVDIRQNELHKVQKFLSHTISGEKKKKMQMTLRGIPFTSSKLLLL